MIERYTRLDRNELTIGRGDEHAVRVNTAGVSRRHAALKRQGPIYVLSDLGSTNGTFVNGEPVTHTPLSPNDVVRAGTLLGVVMRVDAALDLDAPDVEQPLPNLVIGPGLREQWRQVQRLGPSSLPIAVIGQTGAGKEAFAQGLHAASGRRGALQPVNCAALPATLAEAELFGYRKGAFTGAEQAGLGHFRAADGGTLFLDELPELPLAVQSKLLRALQDQKVLPLGETRAYPLDVRIVTAAQSGLRELVAAGKLREDLAMRLDGASIELPPLSARRVDIAVLFLHFLALHAGGVVPEVEPRALEELLLYGFPGNVRELELITRRLLVLHGHEAPLRASFLPEVVRRPSRRATSNPPPAGAERHAGDLSSLCAELRQNGKNLARAAQAIGISRQRAYRLLAGRSIDAVLALTASPVEDEVDRGA